MSRNDLMIQARARGGNSVTRAIAVLSGAVQWAAGHRADARAQVEGQLRSDSSLPVDVVRQVLAQAQAGGMTPTAFEQLAGELRPNAATLHKTLNGSLWHHYMQRTDVDARMKCLTFFEYLHAFVERGWITSDQAEPFAQRAVAVEIEAALLQKRGRRRDLQELVAADVLGRFFPGIDPRKAAALLRNLRAAAQDDAEYLAFLEGLPWRLAGMARAGEVLLAREHASADQEP